MLTVPPSAVTQGRRQERPSTWSSGAVATRTKVTLGLETTEAVEIASGLTEGQKILTSRHSRTRRAGPPRATQMNVARFAARNSRAILLGIVLLSAAGIWAMTTLPSNIYPEVEFPRIVIVAKAGDLSPRLVQLAVTRPLEEAARTVLGARRVTSKTIRGACEISVLFNPDTDMPYALQLMQGKIDEAKASLPPQTTVAVERMTPSLFPIFSFNVTGRHAAGRPARPRRVRAAAAAQPRAGCGQRRGARQRGTRDLGHRGSRAPERRRS